MSLKIKIPKLTDTTFSNQAPMSSTRKRVPRRASGDSEDEDYEFRRGEENGVEADLAPRRARAERLYYSPENPDVDVDAEGEVDIEGVEEDDTRFLPQPTQSKGRSTAKTAKTKSRADGSLPPVPRRRSSGKAKRTVISSDDDDEGEYDVEAERERGDVDDDDYELEPAPKKSGLLSAGKGRASGGRTLKAKAEKVIAIKDERRLQATALTTPTTSSQGMKRMRPKDEDDVKGGALSTNVSEGTPSITGKELEPTPPPVKKRKLPPIKKIKSAAGSAASSTPSARPPIKSIHEKKDDISLVRKPAAALNNQDFDLRDASVYAQLFTKPSGATPNSGLNRKEKEEERKKELHRMRDEDRARRTEETKHTFNLQAAQDKIQRFEEKLHQRKSLAVYPNILGASFKDAYDRVWRSRRT